MKIPIYQVDAFASAVFSGNPAAVCILDAWIDDRRLQAIAAENNLSETAFLVSDEDGFELRWFTPRTEVALCGHATLASAFVQFACAEMEQGHHPVSDPQERANSRLQERAKFLKWTFRPGLLTLRIPPTASARHWGLQPENVYGSEEDLMVVLDSEKNGCGSPAGFRPPLERVDCRGIIITARGWSLRLSSHGSSRRVSAYRRTRSRVRPIVY